jgi:hypothetical protein
MDGIFPNNRQQFSQEPLSAETYFQEEKLVEYAPFHCGSCEPSDTLAFEEVRQLDNSIYVSIHSGTWSFGARGVLLNKFKTC